MTDQLTSALTVVERGYQYTIQIRKAAQTGWIATVHDDIGRLVWQTPAPLPRDLARNRCGAEARQHAARRSGVIEHKPSDAQIQYVADLCANLKITAPALDAYCRERFGVPSVDLTKRMCSELLDDMTTWQQPPADIRRAMGQMDLFEVAG